MADKKKREALIEALEEADRIEKDMDAADRGEDEKRLDKLADNLGKGKDDEPKQDS